MFKVNNKDARTTFTPFFSVSISDFDHICIHEKQYTCVQNKARKNRQIFHHICNFY